MEEKLFNRVVRWMGLRALTDGCMLFMVVRVCQGAVDCIGVGRKRDPYIISDQIQLIEYSPERVPSRYRISRLAHRVESGSQASSNPGI